MDVQMSVLEGSPNAIPSRVVISEGDYTQAMKVLEDAQSDLDA
jgi:hypothetical protein